MLIEKLERKIEGPPIKVGTSKGGMHAFMVGTCYTTFKGKRYERPVVFLDQSLNPNTIPGPEQLMSIDQLIKFSQPKSWELNEAAITQAQQQLKEVSKSSEGD